MGATVTIAKHGMQALRMAQEQSFDLVLMDIQMPGMDGFTTAECWRKTVANDNAAIPIIALSANTGTDSEQQLAESGMQGYIEKPIDVRQLFETINRVLNSVSHR
jgi:two-component system secretion sensor histidine kinase SsrA